MPRQQFFPLMEILSEDMNAFQKGSEKTLLEVLFGNAIPAFPACIGGAFHVTQDSGQLKVAKGIAFQEIAQTDGSSSVRIAHLAAEQTLSLALPAAGVTKYDLVEFRSKVENLPTQQRRFKVAATTEDRPTVLATKWAAEVQVKQNVAPVNGVYVPSNGWVAAALVETRSTGIQRITDLRKYYNLFDPDFFSVYGRRNVAFRKPYDNINLIETPWEFSDLVDKIKQISVLRFTKERFGAPSVQQGFVSPVLALTRPVAAVTRIVKQNFLTAAPRDVTLSSSVNRGEIRLDGLRSAWTNYPDRLSHGGWIDGFWFAFSPSIDSIQDAYIDDLDTLFGANLISAGKIWALFWESSKGGPSGTNAIIYELDYNSPLGRTKNNNNQEHWFWINGLVPIFKSGKITTSFDRVVISTSNPLASSQAGERKYIQSAPINIPNFYQLKDFSYDPQLKQVKFTLKDLTAGVTSFPNQGRVFQNLKIKKGTEIRLNLNLTDLSINLPTTGGVSSGGTTTRGRNTSKDFNLENFNLTAATSDGTTIWVRDTNNNRATAYKVSDGSRDSAKDIPLGNHTVDANRYGNILVTDGTTLWEGLDSAGYLAAYNIATKARDNAKDFSPRGSSYRIWGAASDGTTAWFIDDSANVARAYTLATRARDSSKDINLGNASGEWNAAVTDGTTLWVVDDLAGGVIAKAFNIANKTRDTAKDLNLGNATGWNGAAKAGNNLYFFDNRNKKAIAFALTTTPQTTTPVVGDSAEYTYNLTSQDTLIKSSDSAFGDFMLEFDRSSFLGEEIWRAHALRPGDALSNTVDFKVETEGRRTYVRLNDQFPFKSDDELLFSHIIPQELVDIGAGGTPEEQTVAAQLAALTNQVTALKAEVDQNELDISALQRTSVATDTKIYYGIVSFAGQTRQNRASARTLSTVQPLAQAQAADSSQRSEKTIQSLLLGGALVAYNTGAAAGYYVPWFACESAAVNTIRMVSDRADETTLWARAGTRQIDNKTYQLFVRLTPLTKSKSLYLQFKNYE